MTDVESFDVLEPLADGFRNWLKKDYVVTPEELLLDRAQLLGLTAAEMTGAGGRPARAGHQPRRHATRRVHRPRGRADQRLLRAPDRHGLHAGSPRAATATPSWSAPRGATKLTATRVDLVFGSNSVLRAYAEVYAQDDNQREVRAATSWPPGPR